MNNLAFNAWEGETFVRPQANGGRVVCTRQRVEIIHLDFSQAKPVPSAALLLDDFLDDFENHPDIRAHDAAAREQVAADLRKPGSCERLADLRRAKMLSQKELATLMETSQSMISGLEARKQKPTEDTLRQLAHFLDVSFDRLMAALANG